MNYGLQGKNALITGAAGGFGSALARVLAEEGCNLTLHDADRGETARGWKRSAASCTMNSVCASSSRAPILDRKSVV